MPLNKTTLYKQIKTSGIKYSDIVYAQAILESGNLKSNLVKRNNNIFGMRKPLYRETTAYAKVRGYAAYSHWTCSITDYKLYQDYVFKHRILNRSEYKLMLQRTYSTTPDYIARINKILKSININNRIK
jgi:flagellum-specific peptidoglycan hydrolase FlgJ